MVIDALKKLINEDVHIGMETEYGFLKIKESSIDSKLKEVKIEGIDVDSTFAFKLDYKNYRLSPYLDRTQKEILKACDAIIFTVYKEKGYMLICELKSFYFSVPEVITKMENSTLFLDYIGTILRTLYEESNLISSFERKYVLFHLKESKLPKRETKKNTPPSISFKKIVKKKFKFAGKSNMTLDTFYRSCKNKDENCKARNVDIKKIIEESGI